MNPIKILHCADIHIGAAGSFLGSASALRRYETLITFEKIIDTAKENDVKLIAIAGDLFDSEKPEASFADAVFNKIASVPEIRIVYAAGNHDPLNSESPFITRTLPGNLSVLGIKDDVITFDDLKLHVYGKSFENVYLKGVEKFSLVPPEDDYVNLMVIHGELRSDLGSDYNSITPKFVKHSKMDYIALGHVHKRTEIGRIDNTFFAYCGCPEGQGFDELDEKGVYMGEIGKASCSLKFVPVFKRRHIHEKTDISELDSPSLIYEKVISILKEKYGENYGENLYKIELTGSVSPEFSINTAELTSRIAKDVYFVKVKDSTEPTADLESLAAETSLKGIFVKNMLAKIEQATETDKPLLKNALSLGLKAFTSEVAYCED